MSAVLNTLYPVLKCKKPEINSWKMNEYFGGPVQGPLGGGIDKLYTQIGNVNRLHNIIEPFAALF